jgi:integrase
MVDREHCAKEQERQNTQPAQVPCGVADGMAMIEFLQRRESVTFEEWADLWLGSCRSRLRPSTCHAYEKALKRVRAIIGSLNLSDLTPVVLFAAVAGVDRHGRRAAQESYTVLRTCLQAAADIGVIPNNSMVKVQKPRWEPRQRDYWSVAETQRFIAHALTSPRRWAPLCAFLVTTGLRTSEALGLTWGDVDLEGHRVRVRETLVHVKGKSTLLPPKTKAGRRWVTLDTAAVAAIRKIGTGDNQEGIFRTRTGGAPRHGPIRQTLLVLCEEACVPPLNPHGLRHVAAMLAIKATRDIYLVQRRLGHASPNVTVGIYGYSLGEDEEVANALDHLLGVTGRSANPTLKDIETRESE